MNTTLTSALALNLSNGLRLATLALTLALVTAPVSAKDNSSADLAAQTLASQGRVAVKNAGPYVEHGTFLIQVATKLGQPTVKLSDGTWLYQNYEVENSAARGTLVVRFNGRRVSDLTLVNPTVATAMMAPMNGAEKMLVANNR